MSQTSYMSLKLLTVIKDGARLAASRNGVLFMVLFALFQGFTMLLVLSAGSVYIPVSPSMTGVEAAPPPGDELPEVIAALATTLTNLISGVLLVPVYIVAIRSFVGKKRTHIPDDYIFRRIGWATVNSYIAGFLMLFIIACIFVAPFVPLYWIVGTVDGFLLLGVVLIAVILSIILTAFVWICFLFINHTIAVEDAGPISALQMSWSLTQGHRVRLFILAFFLAVVQGVITSPTALLPDPLGFFVMLPLTSLLTILSLAIFARAYVAIHPEKGAIQRRLST